MHSAGEAPESHCDLKGSTALTSPIVITSAATCPLAHRRSVETFSELPGIYLSGHSEKNSSKVYPN